jgi:hypothetical protein
VTTYDAEVKALRRAAAYPNSGSIDRSGMLGAGSQDVEWSLVADGRLAHVDEVIGGIRQVRFFRITDKGRAWLDEATR